MLFVVSASHSQEEDTTNAIHFYTNTQIRDKKPVQLPKIREADVAWKKRIWRKVEFREKFNQFLYYPDVIEEQNGRESLIAIIWNALCDAKIRAFSDDEFKHELYFQGFRAKTEKIDTIRIQITDEEKGIEIDTFFINRRHFNPQSIKRMEIKEEWIVDKQRSVMDVKILGFCFSSDLEEYDPIEETFIVIGEEVLFWIRYDDPAVREVLATHAAYSEKNDFDQRSYDDIFIQRYFNSYIFKESNVFNRVIIQYATGQDALLESDRIKNELLNKEIDMWEY